MAAAGNRPAQPRLSPFLRWRLLVCSERDCEKNAATERRDSRLIRDSLCDERTANALVFTCRPLVLAYHRAGGGAPFLSSRLHQRHFGRGHLGTTRDRRE